MLKEFNNALKYVEKDPLKCISKFNAFLKKQECKEAYLNMAVAYKNLDNHDKSLEYLKKANDPLVPFSDGRFVKEYDIAVNNMGLLAYSHEDDDGAIKLYHKILESNPENNEAKWNLSIAMMRQLCSLKRNDLADCWKMYTHRFVRNNAEKLRNSKKDLKMWNGLDRVKLVVLSEQGIGDQLMWGRYLSHIRERVDDLYIQCAPILDGVFSEYKVCRDPVETDATHAIPMCSLGEVIDGIPDGEWLKHRYKEKEGGEFKIAINWKGNSAHVNNRLRSTTFHMFKRIGKYGKLYVIGPVDPKTKDVEWIKCETWDETIKALEEVDLVISVDTSIVHLCGSLGKPCWVIMPRRDTDFRWGDSSMGFNNIWYKSVSVFRNPDDWVKVMDKVEEELKRVTNK